MSSVKKQLTLRQALSIYKAVKDMGDSGVSVKGMGLYDLAVDKVKLEPRIIAHEKETRLPIEIEQYNREISICKNSEEGQKVIEKYKDALDLFDIKQRTLKDTIDETFEEEIIMIKKANLIIDEKNGKAAEVLFGLYPLIEE